MNSPTVNTKLVFVLGYPLGHSISPPMHNRVFRKLGMDYLYLPAEASSEDLKTLFQGLCRLNVAGFNVTVPHKIQIMDYLDELDPLAASIGAVNTICIDENKKTRGFNTDGEGYIRSLCEETGITIQGKRMFILGSGGAARAIAMTLVDQGAAKIYLSNRTHAKAISLAEEINTRMRDCVEVITQESTAQKEPLNSCDVLINTTSIGMHPNSQSTPIDTSLLPRDIIVSDIVYNPLETRLLSEARQKGCKVAPGLDMLIYQGAAAFQLWTGLEPLVDEMKKEAYALMAK